MPNLRCSSTRLSFPVSGRRLSLAQSDLPPSSLSWNNLQMQRKWLLEGTIIKEILLPPVSISSSYGNKSLLLWVNNLVSYQPVSHWYGSIQRYRTRFLHRGLEPHRICSYGSYFANETHTISLWYRAWPGWIPRIGLSRH